jgi:hypothetical protein
MTDTPAPVELPYRHTQVGFATLIGLGMGLLTQIGNAARDVRKHRRRAWVSVPIAVGFVAMLAVFSQLRVEVDTERVTASFAAGLLPRRIDIAEIKGAKVITTPWYAGWGMRRTPHGWLYNVWGRRAVELTLGEEATFTIGSDQAETLLAAIEAARAQATPAAA